MRSEKETHMLGLVEWVQDHYPAKRYVHNAPTLVEKHSKTSCATIIEVVSIVLAVSEDAILVPKRGSSINVERHIALYLVYRDTSLKQPEVARMFGCKSPSAVVRAVRYVKYKCLDDDVFRAQIDEIRSLY